HPMEIVALAFLFIEPFLIIAMETATCHDGKTILSQTLTNGGTNATHTPSHKCNFFCHGYLLLVGQRGCGCQAQSPDWSARPLAAKIELQASITIPNAAPYAHYTTRRVT